MSFLGDFAGGAADAGAGIIGNQIKTDQAVAAAQANAKFDNDLAAARAQTIQDMQNKNTDMLRQQGVDRVNTAAQPALNGIIAGNANKLYGNGSSLGIDDLSDEEKTQFAPTADQTTQARIQAAGQTGDIPIGTQAQLSQRSDAANNMLMAKLNHDETISQIAAGHDDTKQLIAGMVHAMKGQGNTDLDKKVSLIKAGGGTDADVMNFLMDRKQPSLEDLANGFLKTDPNAGSPRAMTPADAYAKAQQLRSLVKGTQATPAATPSANRPPLTQFQK